MRTTSKMDRWSRRLLNVGSVMALLGAIIEVGSRRLEPHAMWRDAGIGLVIPGVLVGLAGTVLMVLRAETIRRWRGLPFRSFYQQRWCSRWRSLPALAKFAYSVVVPLMAIVGGLLLVRAQIELATLVVLAFLLGLFLLLESAGRISDR